MKHKWLFLSTGFALFSMFFGSGNLVFPLVVGQESQGHTLLAAIGIISTGVIVPFLGVFGMMLYKGDIDQFFGCFGKKGIFTFSLLSLALMGPFGVMARCLTVAHGALLLLLPSLSLPVTSLLLCALIYFLAVNKNKIVTILGTYLTPFLLGSILLIAYFGLTGTETSFNVETGATAFEALKNGFFQGYQTMDLLAAFFFSKFIIAFLYKHYTTEQEEKAMYRTFFKGSMIGAGLLGFVYLALVFLGWMYSPELANTPPQEMLGRIAFESLGAYAGPCVCLAVVLACVTTAIVLTSLFAEFLQKDVMQNKLKHSHSLLITLAIGFLVSTLDFGGIARFLGPLLETVYPALIVLTAVNIFNRFWSLTATHWPFTLTLVAKMFAARGF